MQLEYARAKEADGKWEDAARAYEAAKDADSVVRLLLERCAALPAARCTCAGSPHCLSPRALLPRARRPARPAASLAPALTRALQSCPRSPAPLARVRAPLTTPQSGAAGACLSNSSGVQLVRGRQDGGALLHRAQGLGARDRVFDIEQGGGRGLRARDAAGRGGRVHGRARQERLRQAVSGARGVLRAAGRARPVRRLLARGEEGALRLLLLLLERLLLRLLRLLMCRWPVSTRAPSCGGAVDARGDRVPPAGARSLQPGGLPSCARVALRQQARSSAL